jgi:hypothetical protein
MTCCTQHLTLMKWQKNYTNSINWFCTWEMLAETRDAYHIKLISRSIRFRDKTDISVLWSVSKQGRLVCWQRLDLCSGGTRFAYRLLYLTFRLKLFMFFSKYLSKWLDNSFKWTTTEFTQFACLSLTFISLSLSQVYDPQHLQRILTLQLTTLFLLICTYVF